MALTKESVQAYKINCHKNSRTNGISLYLYHKVKDFILKLHFFIELLVGEHFHIIGTKIKIKLIRSIKFKYNEIQVNSSENNIHYIYCLNLEKNWNELQTQSLKPPTPHLFLPIVMPCTRSDQRKPR